MPELRQNIITRDWVIIASERAVRPDQIARTRRPAPSLPSFDPACPFCPGNEVMTVREVFRDTDGGSWRVRVVENKYPALVTDLERRRVLNGIHRSMTGVGHHEVVIEHPRHDLSLAQLSGGDIARVLNAYRHRYRDMRKDPRVEAIIIFRNHGEGAGTSLAHPHSQIAATPVVPTQVRRRMEEAVRYFDDTGECVFCHTVREELVARERIVYESNHFVAFIPYAALSPFHLWIFPRRHSSSFDEIFDAELQDFAAVLRQVLARLYYGLGNPDYNYSIRSAPAGVTQTEYFHWYLAIVPRITRTAGFEMGSGMFINTSIPEESAEFLRSISVPDTL